MRIAALCLLLMACNGYQPSVAPSFPESLPERTPWAEAETIRAETALPTFPERTFAVTDFGALGDAVSDDTAALQAAIDACHAAGGGHVNVPSGIYSTGALRLRSRVDLHLQPGSTLRFSGDPARYPTVLTRYEGIECMNHSPMIYAYGEEDVAITGEGTLEASRTARWNQGSNRAGVLEPLVARPVSQRDVTGRLRVAFVEPYRSRRILISGITLLGSSFWQIHPVLSEDVTIDGVTTRSSKVGTDGLDIESCDHVVVRRSSFGSGDDDISLKSGRDEDGRRLNVPSQNIVILNCQGETPYGFLTVGSEETGGVENVYAYHNWTYGQGVGAVFRLKANSRRGGFLRDLFMDDFESSDVHAEVIDLDLDFGEQSGPFTPEVAGVALSHFSIGLGPRVLRVARDGDPPIGPITIRDSEFRNFSDLHRDSAASWTNVRVE